MKFMNKLFILLLTTTLFAGCAGTGGGGNGSSGGQGNGSGNNIKISNAFNYIVVVNVFGYDIGRTAVKNQLNIAGRIKG